MKRFALSVGFAVAVIYSATMIFVGCSTSAISTAYKTESAIDTSVMGGWNLWTNAVKTLNISSNQQVPVVAAFNKIKASEIVLIDATAAAQATTNSATLGAALQAAVVQGQASLTQNLSDLGTLLAQFNLKLP